MKKIYICAIALSLSTLSFAQQLKNKTFATSKAQPSIDNGATATIGSVSYNYKAPGDIIVSEDFNDFETVVSVFRYNFDTDVFAAELVSYI